MDLTGFNLYWGTSPGTYGAPIALMDPAATAYQLELAPGTYYVAITALDADGNESEFSNEIATTVI